MAEDPRRLILANGEKYVETVTKINSGRAGELPRTYGEARQKLAGDVRRAMRSFDETAARKEEEGRSRLLSAAAPGRHR